MTFIGCEGSDILYCDFEKRSEKTGISQWVSPLEYKVWIATAVALAILASFCFLCPGKAREMFLFEMVRTFLQQPDKNLAKLDKFLSIPLMFFGFVLFGHYENLLTSGLIAPPSFKEIKTLREFVEQNFTFLYWD